MKSLQETKTPADIKRTRHIRFSESKTGAQPEMKKTFAMHVYNIFEHNAREITLEKNKLF
jgi:hypothetical protein